MKAISQVDQGLEQSLGFLSMINLPLPEVAAPNLCRIHTGGKTLLNDLVTDLVCGLGDRER